MKRKKGPGILLAAFIVVICGCWLLWVPLKKYVDSTNYENRPLAELPELKIENYDLLPAEYEAYFNDHLPFRNKLITMNSAIDYYLFGRASNEDVIVGKDNWLFYSSPDDGDSIGCYQGKHLLSEETLRQIADNCVQTEQFLQEQGKEFVIFIAPNKERIYSEYVPGRYGEPAETYRALQVVNYLRENTDIRVVYPYEELMEAKSTLYAPIYYKTDTHWNYLGGYVGASALLKELGIEMPEIGVLSVAAGDERAGDLAGMLNLSSVLKKEDIEYTLSGYEEHNVEILESDPDNVTVCRAEDADPRKIYVCRDSFFTHMATYIGSQFNNSYSIHRKAYSYEDFLRQDPDIFVYEVVERSVKTLGKFSLQ